MLPVTGTVIVQVVEAAGGTGAGTFPVVSAMLFVPAAAVRVPPQVLTGAGEAAITISPGSVSNTPDPGIPKVPATFVKAKLLLF